MSREDRISATQTAFEILDVIYERRGATAADLIEATGRSRSGVYKHLRTLVAVDALVNRDGEYVLGPKFTEYGLEATDSNSVLYQTDKIDELAQSYDAPTNLWLNETDRCHCVHTSLGEGREYPRSRGDSERLVESPPGKAILAHLPSARQTAHIGGEDAELTAQLETVQEGKLLEEPLPFAPEWVSIATPVLDPSDRPVAAIEVVVPIDRANGIDIKNNISGLLTETANRMRVEML
ncbi:helix-turn-helix domain-containing protein [Halosolutus gelatinilyticus]|uniref:helix-turn-helix domain-containing protein n=1 Tax=Halosolutus gelatinilyticus TaxID=2931975 RepID=UPI001FF56166|nr:helix-turn-helix domain-containing protein [Halosolutus gelatinilyticus]